MVAGLAFAAGNVVPITDSTETLGTSTKKWGEGNIDWLRLEEGETIKNETDDEFTFESNDERVTLRVKGYEAKDAVIILDADEGDDNADTFTITAEAADNDLVIKNHATEIFALTSGGGIRATYANKTASYTATMGDFILSFDTSAATTCTLPEASTVLGQLFVVALEDDDGNLLVITDGTDKFDGTNDILTFADAGDSCWLMATAANVYTILVNVGGTLSD